MDLRDCQTDVLFLLVGANPLPNYVAALLLAKEGGTVYLMHSEGPKGTFDVAKRLKRAIEAERSSVQILPHGIDEVDGDRVAVKVATVIREIRSNGKTVGLNYTGGTKPMAVHAYHALKDRFPDGCFSYLDARSLRVVIHRGDEPTQMPPVGRCVELSLEALLALHGYTLPVPARQIPKVPALCRAIAEVHSTPAGFDQWRAWTEKFAESPTLPSVEQYPALTPVLSVLRAMCDGRSPSEEEVASLLGFPEFKSCSTFFTGHWLEEYALDSLRQVTGDLKILHYGVDVNPKPMGRSKVGREFNLDLAAMCGYQLFAISCIATHRAQKAKEHLFEVFVRARQLGGDEARFALVCCVDPPGPLQQEVMQTWDAEGRIRVFGQRDLLSLVDCLKDWFRTANKEVP